VDAEERERLQQSMVALARGDRSAFRAVFDGLWPLLLRFCQRMLGEPPLAEDAAQGALMKLLLHAPEFRPDGDVVAWALGAAAFECRSIRNRRARRAEHPGELAAVAENEPSPEAALIEADLGAALREVMHDLRPVDRETLEQVLAPAPPIARNPAFRKRLQRAMERLRLAWRDAHGSDH
jgi:RNA polymerase sigma-70 factor (ECF subfamily)